MKKSILGKILILGLLHGFQRGELIADATELSTQSEVNQGAEKEPKKDVVALLAKQLTLVETRIFELNKDPEKNRDQILVLRSKQKELSDQISKIENLQGKQLNELERFDKKLEKSLKQIQYGVTEATGTMIRPVPGAVITPYSKKKVDTALDNSRFHSGTDFSGYYGEPIKSADGGEVIFSDWMSGYGYTVIIYHKDGLSTLYAHQNQQPPVIEGQMVKQGEVIGYVGSTGYSTGPHLHFEVRKNGILVDPEEYVSFN